MSEVPLESVATERGKVCRWWLLSNGIDPATVKAPQTARVEDGTIWFQEFRLDAAGRKVIGENGALTVTTWRPVAYGPELYGLQVA